MSRISGRIMAGWVLMLTGAAIALLFAWLRRLVSVPLTTLLTAAVVVLALSWLVALVTVPWNLYYAARRAAASIAESRGRGLSVAPGSGQEAGRISGRMLWFALTAHVGTAVAAIAIASVTGRPAGYYVAGIFVLATAFRPAAAYLWHVRERISDLTRQSTHPREDVATLRAELAAVGEAVGELRSGAQQARDDLRRAEAALTDLAAHNRGLLVADLERLREVQDADRSAARSRQDDLRRRIEQMARTIEVALDGISDHQELMTGLRALVRMVRSETA